MVTLFFENVTEKGQDYKANDFENKKYSTPLFNVGLTIEPKNGAKFEEIETSISTLSTNLVEGETTYTTFKKAGDQLRALNEYVSGATENGGLDGRIDAVETQLAGAEYGSDKTVTGYVTGYVADKIAELSLDAAVTGVVEPAAPLSLGINDAQQLTGAVAYDGKTIDVVSNKLAVVAQLSAITTNAGYASSYALVDKEGNKLGDDINIPKDQFLSGAEYNSETETIDLTFAVAADGVTPQPVTTSIPVGDLVHEYTGASGIAIDTVTNGNSTIYGVVDPASETFLTVGADGFKLAGVQNAIDTASGALKADIDYVSGQVGTLSNLTTDEKTTIVGAINEVDEHAEALSTVIGAGGFNNMTLTGVLSGETTVVGAFNETAARIEALEAAAGTAAAITDSLIPSGYATVKNTASQGSVHNTAKELIGAADDAELTIY